MQKNFFKGVFVFLCCFFGFVSDALACQTKHYLPTAICRDAGEGAVEYFQHKNHLFKIPVSYKPKAFESFLIPQGVLVDGVFQGGQITLHALFDNLDATCSYVENNIKSISNLYRLYHYPKLMAACRDDLEKGPYLPEFVEHPIVVTIPELRNNTPLEDFAYEYGRFYEVLALREADYRGYQEDGLLFSEGMARLLLLRMGMSGEVEITSSKTLPNFEVLLLDDTKNKVEEPPPETVFIDWRPAKRLAFKSKKNTATRPMILSCYYRHGGEKIIKAETLSQYEMCELTFVDKKHDLYLTARFHGSHVKLENQSPVLEPLAQKIVDFVMGFAIPEDDLTFLKYQQDYKERKSKSEDKKTR